MGVRIGSGAGGARRMSDHLPTMLFVLLIIIAISWWSDTHQF